MKPRMRVWLAAAGCAALAGAALWLARGPVRPVDVSPAAMRARLPAGDAVILWVDFDALRRTGLLEAAARSQVAEEPDYQAFVRSTGFDYKSDLEAAAGAFLPDGEFFVVRGKFDWGKLRAYAQRQGGGCYNDLCRLPASSPGRNISFLPLAPNLMSLAVSSDGLAAARLKQQQHALLTGEGPGQPLWLSVPSASLRKTQSLPGGTGLFAKALEGAETMLLSLGPAGTGYEARLEVTCPGPQEAMALAAQLERITSLLHERIARARREPNPSDLSGVLAAGVFQAAGRRVTGRWPLGVDFLAALAGAPQP